MRYLTRPAMVILASAFALGLAACEEGGTPEQTGQAPPPTQQEAPATTTEPAPPPGEPATGPAGQN